MRDWKQVAVDSRQFDFSDIYKVWNLRMLQNQYLRWRQLSCAEKQSRWIDTVGQSNHGNVTAEAIISFPAIVGAYIGWCGQNIAHEYKLG